MDKNFDEQLIKPVPNERQTTIFEMGYYNFIHFGINTFTHKEWGSGHEPLTKFKLKTLDTDKWVQDLMATGSKGVILTAKHHDGFLFVSKQIYRLLHKKYSIYGWKRRCGGQSCRIL